MINCESMVSTENNKSLRLVNLRVQTNTCCGETVCITGNIKQLGKWKVSESLPMKEESPQSGVWTVSFKIPTYCKVLFRYFIGVILESECKPSGRKIIIRQWETHLHPRKLNLLTDENDLHIFGYYENHIKIDPGWLTEQNVLQFKLYNNYLNIWKNRYKGKDIYIRVNIIDTSSKRDTELLGFETDDSTMGETAEASWPVVEIATMSDDNWRFKHQNQFGHKYNQDEYVIFSTQMLYPKTVGYKIDFYCQMENHGHPQHIGFCIILSNCLKDTTGSFTIPITGKSERPIGQLSVDYLSIHPLKGSTCDCSITYASHWKHGFTQLDVGHRGAGKVRRAEKTGSVLENTVASFNFAANHGADMVELDVQLTKDKIPIVYHDYYICLCPRKKKTPTDHDLLEVAVKDLTEQQLKMLKLNPATGDSTLFRDDDSEDNQPFPTLEYCLKAVVESTGFNIEIKSPMQLQDGTWELDQRFELNNYVDTILTTILKYAGSRYIILSCFDPDICSMVRLKQNRYPLLFLTQGKTERYPAYLDPRTSSIPMAAYFALSIGLLGIDVHSEELLKDRSLINFVKSRNLVLFIWGDDINCPLLINSLKEQGVDGIIYDKVDEFVTNKEAVFMIDPTLHASILEDVEMPEIVLE